ncbi:MAG TPA: MFS transporter [Candidatus Saccharimonadia bacterium]|nr:MFS transporter [Candidatus Saccharimonadia bacterium]
MYEQPSVMPKEKTNWLILVVLALAQFMLIVDVTIVNIALPTIQRTFNLSNTNLQWIITGYALTFGGFLLLGGRMTDLFSRRAIFLSGLALFTLASLGSGLSQSGGMLIVFRAIQGFAGAFMSPAALSMVLVTYREGTERNIALSIWGAVGSAGGALGILLGGVFTQYLGWRWNFFINVPIGVIVFIAALFIVGSYKSEDVTRRLDLVSSALVAGGLMVLVYALTKASTYGWRDHRTLTYFAISAIALVAFVINETEVKQPLLPLRIFRTRNLAGADAVMLLMAAGLFSSIFLATLYVQDILGYSAIKTGVSFLIFPVCVAIAATNVPRIIKRIGYRPILIGAPMLMSAGLFFESGIPLSGSYWVHVAPGLVLMALGMGATFVSVTIAATSGVARQDAGLASGLVTTSQQIGGAIGLAAIISVAASSTTRYLQNLGLLGPPSHAVIALATIHGFQIGYLTAGYIALAAAILAALSIRPTPVPTAPPATTTVEMKSESISTPA